jgi:hypothetical protein
MSAKHQQAAQQRIAGNVAPLTLRNAPERDRWAAPKQGVNRCASASLFFQAIRH